MKTPIPIYNEEYRQKVVELIPWANWIAVDDDAETYVFSCKPEFDPDVGLIPSQGRYACLGFTEMPKGARFEDSLCELRTEGVYNYGTSK